MKAGEVIVRNTDNAVCTAKPGLGYTIRLKGYNGATIVVNERGEIQISLSGTYTYDVPVWKILNDEIQIGLQYMMKVRLAGGYGRDVEKPRKGNFIPTKNYRPLSIYRRYNGNYELYLGEGVYTVEGCNRSGCRILVGEIHGGVALNSIIVTGNVLDLAAASDIWFDSYSTKNRKYVECVWQYTGTYYSEHTVHVNRKPKISFRFEGRGGR